MTMDEIYERFVIERKDEIKPSTMSAYMMTYVKKIRPVFGKSDVIEVKTPMVQEWVDSLSQSLSPHSVRDCYVLFKSMIRWHYAKEDKKSPAFKVKFPHEEKKELEVYSRAEQKKLVSYIEEHPGIREFGILLCLSTGMRIGELCGLKWEDVDFDKNCINIRRTVERCYNIESRKTTVYIGPPKSMSSRRTIPIPRPLVQKMKKMTGLVKPDYYILSGKTKPEEPRTYRNFFVSLLEHAGVRRLKFHGLRHSFATLMVESKADIKTLSTILGHSGIEITMDTYVHPSNESKRNQMAKAFKGIL